MNNDENGCTDVQQLNCKMATITTSSLQTLKNTITEHVLNNELTNFVNNKLNLDNLDSLDKLNLDNNLDTLDTNQSNGHLNDKHNLKNKTNRLNGPTDQQNLSNAKLNHNLDNGDCVDASIKLLENDEGRLFDDDKFLITNPSTINLLKENLNLIKSDYFNNKTDDDLNDSAQQLKNIFTTIRQTINTANSPDFQFITNSFSQLTNQLTNQLPTNKSKTKTKKLLIEKNLLFNQFYNSTGTKFNDNLDMANQIKQQINMNQLNNNNNKDNLCNLEDCNQFSPNHNQFSKLITDDYLTEHDSLNHFLNATSNFSSLKQISPIRSSGGGCHHTKNDDEDEEIFEDVDQNLDVDLDQTLTPDLNRKETKANSLDVETMKSQLAKLKLDELNDDNDNENDYFDAIDEDEEIRMPMIRSTSLKTSKTKNLGPESKKMVRFADAMGLDLAKVKNISQEDLPNVPASAFLDLKMREREVKEEFFNNQLSCSPVRSNQQPNYWNQFFGQSGRFNAFTNNNNVNRFNSNKAPIISNGVLSGTGSDLINRNGNWPILVPEFVQPFTMSDFIDRVRSQNVCLESCVVSSIGNNLSIDCLIRVNNISFEKVVMLRYTNNDWSTWLDSLASYIPNSCDGTSDKFSVKFYVKSLSKGQRVKFAIKYITNSAEYWDNNRGIDYCLHYKT